MSLDKNRPSSPAMHESMFREMHPSLALGKARTIQLRAAVASAALVLQGWLALPTALAQYPQTRLLASDGMKGDGLGTAVATDGSRMVIGAMFDDGWAGSAYVFLKQGSSCVQEAKLVASDRAAKDQFGASVSILGSLVAVGAPDDDANRGAVYVFARQSTGAWVQKQKLVSPDPHESFFGHAVSLSGGDQIRLAVGVPQGIAPQTGVASGCVYVYHYDATHPRGPLVADQELVAKNPTAGAAFGTSVALNGDALLVGATGVNSARGSAYVFRNTVGRDGSSWFQEKQLDAATTSRMVRLFGWAVALDNDIAVVGAPWTGLFAEDDTGGAYVFRRDKIGQWSQEAELLSPPTTMWGDKMGASVAVSGTMVAVGASEASYKGYQAGSVHLYQWKGSARVDYVTTLFAFDATPGDAMGFSCGLAGKVLVAGALGNDDKGQDSGSAYVIALP